jgi:putative transposase
MRRSRYSDEQIIGILKQHQAGVGAKELCRKHGISDATFYKWRSKYGGMDVPDARKLKALEEENRKLKKLLAETVLDAATLKEMLAKNF